MKPSEGEIEKAVVNFKTNRAPGEDDITAERIENSSRELKSGFVYCYLRYGQKERHQMTDK